MQKATYGPLSSIALVLLVIGGINWGLVGLFDFNLVAAIFGGIQWLESLIYVLVGISAIVVAGHALSLTTANDRETAYDRRESTHRRREGAHRI